MLTLNTSNSKTQKHKNNLELRALGNMLLTSVDTGRGRVGGGRGPFIKDRIYFSKKVLWVMTGTFSNVTSFKLSLQR